MADRPTLHDLVAAELAQPVDPRVAAMAEGIAARYGAAARAVLFYGSCLREGALDDASNGTMLDFYLIVSSYREAYGRGWLAFANRLIPPNVFPFAHDGLAAKYAVLSEADFARENGLDARSVSVWARFAQPSRLVWSSDEQAEAGAVTAVANAAPTLFQFTLPMMRDRSGPFDIWQAGFALTYGAELRAERADRSLKIVEAWLERYHAFTEPTLAAVATQKGVGPNGDVPFISSPRRMRGRWRRMRLKGKALSLIRLAKATTTFAGGVDYIAWKINRHAGTAIEVRPWQRRWPILGALILLPRLLRRGAVR